MKRTVFISSLFLGIFAISFSSTAQSQNTKPKGQKPAPKDLIAKLDRDKDGKLSIAETMGPLKNDFSKIDSNKDGFITEEELMKAPKPKKQETLKRVE